MNKNEFKKIVRKDLVGKSVKTQLAMLEKMHITTRMALRELSEEVEKNYTYCRQCDNYHLTKDYKTEKKIETVVEQTYTDAGYGDDDRMGEVEYVNTYMICPKNNKHRFVVNRTYVRIICEWGRNDWKK